MRTVIGVIAAFVTMSVVVFALSVAPWFLFGVEAVLVPQRFESTTGFNAYAVLIGMLGAVLGIWVRHHHYLGFRRKSHEVFQ